MIPVQVVELPTPPNATAPKFLTDRSPDRLQKLITHPLRFHDIHGTHLLPRREARRMTPRRLERRTDLVKVAIVLLRHCDLVSLRIGAPRILSDTSEGREVTPPGHEALIAESGVSPTSFRRCVAEMKRAGWLTGKQPRYIYEDQRTGDTRYGSLRVVYTLTKKFFEALGLDRRLKVERDKAVIRAGERRRIYALGLLEARDAGEKARRAVVREQDAAARARGSAAKAAADEIDARENAARQLIGLKLRLRQAHPDWGADRIDREARALLERL